MPRKSQFTVEQQEQIIELYQQGNSTVKIAEMFNSKAPTIASLVKKKLGSLRSNKENSRKFFYNKDYFNEIDTPEKAYWLGFIYADGYVALNKEGNKRFGVALSIKDRSHLELLNKALDSTYEIKEYDPSDSNYGTEKYCRLQIFGEEIFDNLVRHGVVPNKTNIVNPPSIDESLHSHFIRGYMDGDVCITSSKEDYVVKILGTEALLDFIKDFIERNEIAKIRKYYKRKEDQAVSSLELPGNYQVKRFLDLIYKDSTVHMQRKYNNYIELCSLLHSRLSGKPLRV